MRAVNLVSYIGLHVFSAGTIGVLRACLLDAGFWKLSYFCGQDQHNTAGGVRILLLIPLHVHTSLHVGYVRLNWCQGGADLIQSLMKYQLGRGSVPTHYDNRSAHSQSSFLPTPRR